MRKITKINDEWVFSQNNQNKKVNLPHCWNSIDGTTKNYIRTKSCYSKSLLPSSNNTFLLIEGANSVCDVMINDKIINSHKGGYAGFITEITDYIKDGCKLDIYVDNSDFADVYPTRADFTFWGGLYRNVSIIETGKCHFSFNDYSSQGLYVTPEKTNGKWQVNIKALVDGKNDNCTAKFTLLDAQNKEVSSCKVKAEKEINIAMQIENPILWNGIENPYLYTLKAEILCENEILDNISIRTGFRTYYIDNENGFFLNNKYVKIKGVSRHQDRENMGNGITEKEHAEDLNLVIEMGANSVRLAHYQQNQYFYDLCDEKGILVWAESPIISAFSVEKQNNAKQQLTELVKQNYNHPSIFCWGIQNEITQEQKGAKSKQLIPAIKELNSLVKKLDKTRYSTCAQLSILDQNSDLNFITDIEGYNNYFGWYDFSFGYLNRWLNDFHKEHKNVRLCLSEYGAEGLVNLHSANPVQGDYSEEYQCIFHENYIKAINSRDWIWGSYVWNMFDFGAANRREGGVVGKNNKGLVTYDRKTKKDSYYLYKAYWSKEKFVHICSERFFNRKTGKTDIKIYSNCNKVTLKVNGKEYSLEGEHIFVFNNITINKGSNIIAASSESCTHQITVNGVEIEDASYRLNNEQSLVRNWAEKSESEKQYYLSPDSTIKELVKSKDAHIIVEGKLNKDYLKIPLLKIIYPIKIKTVLNIAKKFGLTQNHYNLLTEYTFAIHK